MKIHDVTQFINHDSELLTILRHLPSIDSDGPWVAGGSVWKSIEGKSLDTDIDFFFKSPQQCEYWFRTLLSMPYVQRIVSEPKANDYNTSLKYHVSSRGFNKTIKLQLISFMFFNDIDTLLNGFDFTACQFAFDGRHLFSGETSFDDLRNREIIFNNVRDNIATGIHLEKYVKNGFKIPDSQKEKFNEIAKAMNKTSFDEAKRDPRRVETVNITEPPRAVRHDDDRDGYPRNTENNQGLNLVRATQMPQTPPRQENDTARARYATTTFNTSWYQQTGVNSSPQPIVSESPYPTDSVAPSYASPTEGLVSNSAEIGNTMFSTRSVPFTSEYVGNGNSSDAESERDVEVPASLFYGSVAEMTTPPVTLAEESPMAYSTGHSDVALSSEDII